MTRFKIDKTQVYHHTPLELNDRIDFIIIIIIGT